MKYIIKRAGHTEAYDSRKLYASVFAACLALRDTPATAELIAAKVVQDVEQWLSRKHEVTSNDIRRVAGDSLRNFNPEAGYLFLHHRVVH